MPFGLNGVRSPIRGETGGASVQEPYSPSNVRGVMQQTYLGRFEELSQPLAQVVKTRQSRPRLFT